MSQTLFYHNDPTLEGAQRMEINEKGCAICDRAQWLSTGKSVCTKGKKFPFCKSDRKNGFRLIS